MPIIRKLTAAEKEEFWNLVGAPESGAQGLSEAEFLDRSVKDITAELAGQAEHVLRALKEAEANGKARKSLLDAMDRELGRLAHV